MLIYNVSKAITITKLEKGGTADEKIKEETKVSEWDKKIRTKITQILHRIIRPTDCIIS